MILTISYIVFTRCPLKCNKFMYYCLVKVLVMTSVRETLCLHDVAEFSLRQSVGQPSFWEQPITATGVIGVVTTWCRQSHE